MAKRKRSTSTLPLPNPAAPGTGTAGPATNADRRDQARQERVAGGVLLLTRSRSPSTGPVRVSGAPSVNTATLPGILTGPAPWPAFHQHPDLYVNGTKQVVPGQIGIITSPQVVFSPLHTHDTGRQDPAGVR
jgi:hypothetical protein